MRKFTPILTAAVFAAAAFVVPAFAADTTILNVSYDPGAALAAKRGEIPVSKLKGASKSMYESMSERQLDEFASTKRKGKPEHVRKSS